MWFAIITIFIKIWFCYAVDYCKLCETHTMCNYKATFGDSCINYTSVKMNTHLQTLIVNTHNKLRSNVALGLEKRKNFTLPSASNMLGLIWDNELAMIAQRWADTCRPLKSKNVHDICRKTSRFEVGQNIFTYKSNSSSEPNFISMILDWYSEIDNIANAVKNDYENCMQLIWADTQYIGCGHSSFQEEPDNSYVTHRFICNYGPSGNIEGKAIYKEGQPCSECTSYFKCDSHFPGLCFEERTLEVENRIRELVKTVNDLITQRSNERLKYTKQINGTNMKINDFSYTDVIIDYLAKALDYHKDHFNELSNMNEQSTDEINGNMRNLHNKSFNDVMLSEYGVSGLIAKKSDFRKIGGIWNDGSCRYRSIDMDYLRNLTKFYYMDILLKRNDYRNGDRCSCYQRHFNNNGSWVFPNAFSLLICLTFGYLLTF